MSNIPISSLPVAISLDGSEIVPIVQGGTTKRTTVADIGTFPASGASFVVATPTPSLTGSRVLSAQAGVLTVTDGGPLGDITVGVAANGIGDGQLRQGAELSVIGNATSSIANVADIAAENDFQILRRSGPSLGFGSIDLSQTNAVGTSILQPVNGGTGVDNGASTLTLGGSLTTVGPYSSTFTMTGDTSVTFPTSGTLATTSGPNLPSVVQGDLLYGVAPDVLSTLAKNTTATRYLSNAGSNNNPAWAQVDLTTGVAGVLPVANGGTGQGLFTANELLAAGSTAGGALQQINSGQPGQALLSNGAGALPSFQSISSPEPVTRVTGGSATISAGTPAVAVVRSAPTSTAITLPSVSSQGLVPIHIFDWSSSVSGHTITLTPTGPDTIMNAASWQLFSNSASLAGVTLYPSITLGGWYIAP